MKHSIKKIYSKKFCIILLSFLAFLSQAKVATSQTFQNGDVFVAVSNGQVQWRSSTGILKQTLNTGLGGFTTGMAFDAAGNLYITNFSANSISRFNTSGVLQGTFGSGYSTPESIVFDNTGNAYVGNLGNGIRKYNAAGTFLGSSFTGRVDFMDLAADQCTMLYTTESSFIGRHNVCTNTVNPNFASGLGGNAFALRLRQNGEVLIANGVNILRLSPTGTILQTYDVNGINTWFALNLNPDGTSFWSADINTSNVYKIDIATGNVLLSFNTGTAAGSTVYGLAVFGEFTVSVCEGNIAPAFIAPSPACGSTIQATVGSPVSFTVTASDGDAADIVTLDASGLPSGATMMPALPRNGNPVSSTFSWTPTSANIGNNVVSFSATDKCVQVLCSYTINVTSGCSTCYYSKATGDLHNVLTWGLNPDGSGANPPDFTAGKTFNLANRPGIYTMTADWTVGGIIVNPPGSQLQINGFTLSEAALTGAGTLTGSLTSNLIVTGTTGGDAGALNFTSGGGSLNNLTLDRTGVSASATVGSVPLSLYGVLTLTNGTLNTNNTLTLKSSAANTARVAPVTGNITGTVTVERYIPARRAWRIMSAPVGGSQTISAAWQEGVTTSSVNPDPNPGYGTHITQGSPANGFDNNPLIAMMSIKRYLSATDTWTVLPNTNATAVNTNAYMLFVRGHRSTPLGENTVPPTITTLRATGSLKTGDQTFPVSATGFTAIPNPFASPINFATLTRDNVQNNFSLWDPKVGGTYGVGGYVTVSFNGTTYDVSSNAVSPESQYIQSGQGFLVRTITTGVSGSITIKEGDKSNTAATDVFRMAGDNRGELRTTAPAFADPTKGQGLRLKLQTVNEDRSTAVLDEVFASYKPAYSNKVDQWDAVKPTNMSENLGIVRDNQTLVIERRSLPVENDVINLKIWNTEQKGYTLEFNPVNLSATGLFAYLEDKYLKTVTPVRLDKISQTYFTVTSDAASARADRFSIVFSKIGKPEDVITKNPITAYPNPVTGRSINLQFTTKHLEGTYLVTLVNSAGRVVVERSIQHTGGAAVKNILLDKKLSEGVYQLQVTGKNTHTTTEIISH